MTTSPESPRRQSIFGSPVDISRRMSMASSPAASPWFKAPATPITVKATTYRTVESTYIAASPATPDGYRRCNACLTESLEPYQDPDPSPFRSTRKHVHVHTHLSHLHQFESGRLQSVSPRAETASPKTTETAADTRDALQKKVQEERAKMVKMCYVPPEAYQNPSKLVTFYLERSFPFTNPESRPEAINRRVAQQLEDVQIATSDCADGDALLESALDQIDDVLDELQAATAAYRKQQEENPYNYVMIEPTHRPNYQPKAAPHISKQQ
eukprot:TRINITY_DN128_c2_g1_i1.p1 TRINITY_DN128_c2_g1~~TRINITY_DN128_c2_g1_i1.p1  ORF type:complete len:269 (-),score=26.00 TRINITY_DN128_c2_g1_i1:340-1146(-)